MEMFVCHFDLRTSDLSIDLVKVLLSVPSSSLQGGFYSNFLLEVSGMAKTPWYSRYPGLS